jgi:hypothetical protein
VDAGEIDQPEPVHADQGWTLGERTHIVLGPPLLKELAVSEELINDLLKSGMLRVAGEAERCDGPPRDLLPAAPAHYLQRKYDICSSVNRRISGGF